MLFPVIFVTCAIGGGYLTYMINNLVSKRTFSYSVRASELSVSYIVHSNVHAFIGLFKLTQLKMLANNLIDDKAMTKINRRVPNLFSGHKLLVFYSLQIPPQFQAIVSSNSGSVC